MKTTASPPTPAPPARALAPLAPTAGDAPATPAPKAVLYGGQIRPLGKVATKRKRRLHRGHPITFAISEHRQKLLLKLPALTAWLVAAKREHVVLLAESLAGRVSANDIAAALNLAPSRLSEWRKLYREGGRTALMPKPIGPRAQGNPGSTNLCELLLPR